MRIQQRVGTAAAGIMLALALVGCQPVAAPSGGSTPPAAGSPEAETEAESAVSPATEGPTVWYVENGDAHDPLNLAGADADLADQLTAVLGSVNAQARTFFDATRFAAEVETLPHVRVLYPEVQDFEGEGINWPAQEVVLVAVIQGDGTGEPMVLARSVEEGDWSVYLPSSGEAVMALIDVARSRSQGGSE